MKSNKIFSTTEVGLENSSALLEYDYNKLGRAVSRAVIKCPAILSLMGQKDLSVLTKDNTCAPEVHMQACVRMTCAFIGLKDPYPRKNSAV